jgi:GMP synthase (glutamine-hydrolysing)
MAGRALIGHGIPQVCLRADLGERYPLLSEISGIVSLGGPMGANDEREHPWIREECLLLRRAADQGLPIAGICLGGQLLARSLGARVNRNPVPEIGWHPVQLTQAGEHDPVISSAAPDPTFFQWHQDSFELPSGAELLGRSEPCSHQAYRWGDRAYGFQFHPEVDTELLRSWLAAEGSDEEIELARKLHGEATIQIPDAQLREAPQNELFGLRMCIAIARFFEGEERPDVKRPHGPASGCVEMEIEGDLVIKGEVVAISDHSLSEYLVIRDPSSKLWPIRLDRIKRVAQAGR